MKRFISIGILSLLAFAITLSAHAARLGSPLPKFENVTIAKPGTPDAPKKVHDAILSGAAQYGWRVVSDNGDTLRLNLSVRRHVVEVDVHVRGNAVSVDYVDSVNMDYEKDASDPRGNSDACGYVSNLCRKNMGEVIHPNYGKWVKNLLNAARKAAR